MGRSGKPWIAWLWVQGADNQTIAAPFCFFAAGGCILGIRVSLSYRSPFFLQYMVKIIVWFSVFEWWEMVLDGFFYTFAVE